MPRRFVVKKFGSVETERCAASLEGDARSPAKIPPLLPPPACTARSASWPAIAAASRIVASGRDAVTSGGGSSHAAHGSDARQ